jgi:hypothetical protein
MLKTYELACNIDIMCSPRITISKGRYPGITLISTEEEPARRPLTAAEGLALYGNGPEPVRVTAGGVQMKEPKAR